MYRGTGWATITAQPTVTVNAPMTKLSAIHNQIIPLPPYPQPEPHCHHNYDYQEPEQPVVVHLLGPITLPRPAPPVGLAGGGWCRVPP